MRIGMSMGMRMPVARTLTQRIAALFATNTGAWSDYSLLTQEFQDSAGTTPVTAVEQPLGKVNDQSGGGNHTTQATADNRPVLSSRVNLLLKSDQLTDGAWGKTGAGTGTTPVVTDNYGESGVSRIQFDKGAGDTAGDISTVAQDGPSVVVIGSSYYGKCEIKATDGASVGKTLLRRGVGRAAYTSIVLTAEWQAFGGDEIAAAVETVYAELGLRGSFGAAQTADVLIRRCQSESGSAATRYQRVNTASDYDTAGFPLYAKFDGVNDSLATTTGGGGTAGFSHTQVIKPTGGAGTVRTIWSDAGANTGRKVELDAANKLSFSAGDGVAFTTKASTATVDVGVTSLITVRDDGVNLSVQINSAAAETVARPAVAAGTAAVTVGTNFVGNLYPPITTTDSGLTAAQRATAQAWCRSKAGL